MNVTQILNNIEENKKNIEFLKTGLRGLDDALDGGFMRKELVVLGGSTGIGKSYLSGQLMYNIASQGYKSAYFSLEISNEMIISRMLGMIGNIKSARLMTSRLSNEELRQKTKARAQLQTFEDYMEFYDNIYSYEAIEQTIKEKKFEFVIIDFIQNIIIKGMDEYSKLSYVALQLQKLAKEVNCCILVLSQLSNTISRENSGMTLEYKGSGSIATVCDLGFFVIRPNFELAPEEIKLLLRKNRRGPSGLAFDFKFKTPGGAIV